MTAIGAAIAIAGLGAWNFLVLGIAIFVPGVLNIVAAFWRTPIRGKLEEILPATVTQEESSESPESPPLP